MKLLSTLPVIIVYSQRSDRVTRCNYAVSIQLSDNHCEACTTRNRKADGLFVSTNCLLITVGSDLFFVSVLITYN